LQRSESTALTSVLPRNHPLSVVNIHIIYKKLSPVFRAKRMKRFLQVMVPAPGTRILDVGGYPGTWEGVDIPIHVTLLNLPKYSEPPHTEEKFEYVHGDGRDLHYPDQSWEIVFSNSVIEHLGDIESQKAFAFEIRRVGKRYWVQTPAKEFFMEPHLLTPFIHWLPRRWIPALLRHFTGWGLLSRPTKEQAMEFWHAVDLRQLNYREFRALFPDGEIIVERFAGMPKSYIAVKR